jgi:hypothetical protein
MPISNAVSVADLADLIAHGDGVEVMPCATDGESCEPCPADAADIQDDHRDSAKAAAIRYAESLLEQHPQLRKYGVVVGF